MLPHLTAHTILQLAQDSHLIYSEWEAVAHELRWRGLNAERYHILDREDGTQSMVYFHHGIARLIFRGTEESKDWETNLKISTQTQDFARKFDVRGEIHTGFLEAYLPLRSAIKSRLNLWGRPPLQIAGHSLGGALAAIAALDFAASGYPLEFCVTFGQPQCFNRALATAISPLVPIFQFVNRFDIVPHLPIGRQFRQREHQMFLMTTDQIKKFRPSLFWQLYSLIGYLLVLFKPGIQAVTDHSIELYCDRISQFEEKLQTLIQSGIDW